MGLAASQARLLTITTRKADCEYQSMRLSHQKIALSRDMTTLSNEYQNSLTKTKLVYDFYGTGDTSTPLSYSLMMTPSILNNNVPIMLTNAEGRVVLDAKYAAAARAAGIPQEGINGFPSEAIRNAFLDALGDQGIISKTLAESLKNITYDPTVGVGTSPSERIITEQGNLDALKDRLAEVSTSTLSIPNFDPGTMGEAQGDGKGSQISTVTRDENGNGTRGAETVQELDITINDLLGDTDYIWWGYGDNPDNYDQAETAAKQFAQYLEEVLVPWLNEQLLTVLDIGDADQAAALDYALTETMLYFGESIVDNNGNLQYTNSHVIGKDKDHEDNRDKVLNYFTNNDTDLGFVISRQHGGAWHGLWGQGDPCVGINLNNVVDVYLTFFADSLANLESDYNVLTGANSKANSNLVTSDDDYLYTFKVGSEYSSANLAASQFYDALFNQLCQRGWVESGVDKNGESLVHDNEYIQEMLANGMMYMTTLDDDGYYYQGNYSTNSYVKEIPDEDAIALAEAKYQTEKQKINSKEETIDMKMKNLDTEISSLTTEYDTVKSVISKNIEKSFKRYQA